jgi:hypothetical protein
MSKRPAGHVPAGLFFCCLLEDSMSHLSFSDLSWTAAPSKYTSRLMGAWAAPTNQRIAGVTFASEKKVVYV